MFTVYYDHGDKAPPTHPTIALSVPHGSLPEVPPYTSVPDWLCDMCVVHVQTVVQAPAHLVRSSFNLKTQLVELAQLGDPAAAMLFTVENIK